MTQLHLNLVARPSQLSLIQAGNAVAQLEATLPCLSCELTALATPGDHDRNTDLRVSDPDFFTRTLDDAVREHRADGAVHSAKDLPDPVADDLDWFWLPWREDPRDCLVMRPGETIDQLPPEPRVGVSSDRRELYCRQRFPNGEQLSIRGNIEERLAQLDEGSYDVLLMAGAALIRLGLTDRVTEWIPLSALRPPDGQGYLAITYRQGDERFNTLRNLFVKQAILVGGGPGHPGLCTAAGVEALKQCDVCMYDALSAIELLAHLPADAQAVDVGKRRGSYKVPRGKLEQMMVDHVRRGRRLVRLKGGDPGMFGRLAEETDALAKHALPFRVLPGVSSLNAATTSTGLLLTRRHTSHGFNVLTPSLADDAEDAISANTRSGMALVFFMAVQRTKDICTQLQQEGRSAQEPATMIYGAGRADQLIIQGNLGNLAERVLTCDTQLPGLLIVGPIANEAFLFPQQLGALAGRKVLLTCSNDIMPQAIAAVEAAAGVPIPCPMIQLAANPDVVSTLNEVAAFDWLLLSSPAAVRCLFELLGKRKIDVRTLPKILVSGPAVAKALAQHAIVCDACPKENFGADAMLALASERIATGAKVLRLRSDAAGPAMAESLQERGFEVTDAILYHNSANSPSSIPAFDAAFLASGSAAATAVDLLGKERLNQTVAVAIGTPTTRRLEQLGISPTVIAYEPTVEASIHSLAAYYVNAALQRLAATEAPSR